MTYREKMVIAILLLVARLLCDQADIAREIRTIATSISVQKDPA